jgi:RNA polymerase sigma-70 factor (ECF subfamily)
VIAVFRAPGDVRPGYFIELGLNGEKIRSIRDFRYVPYVMQDAAVVL